ARSEGSGREGAPRGEERRAMIPELGQVALCVALTVSLFLSFSALYGAARADAALMAFARPAAQGQALLVAFAFGCLVHSFVVNDFSVLYVATNSNSALPLQY